MVESVSYKQVLTQLKAFIRKYYLNRTFQGLLISLLVFLIVAGALVVGNQGLRLNIEWRTIGFWALCIGMGAMVLMIVIVPFLQFLGVGRRLNNRSAERIVSSHFGEMKDTLLNMLELADEYNKAEDNSLLLASIEDKAGRIKWYRFDKAVPFKKLLKYLPFIGGLFLTAVLTYILWPDFVSEGYARTVKYKTEFDAPPVYEYKLLNDSLTVALGRDLEVRAEPLFDAGEENIYLRQGQNRYIMEEGENGALSYTIKAINAPVTFRFQYQGISSEVFEIEVIPTPELVQFTAQSFPPPYTKIEGMVLNNEGDLDIPLGSKVIWSINTMFTDQVRIIFPSDTLTTNSQDNIFTGQKRIMESGNYKIVLGNSETEEQPELGFNIRVRPDLYPEMDLNEIRDSLIETQIYFQGFISDDYGFSRLEFNVERMDGSNVLQEDLLLNKNGTNMRFYHAKDMADVGEEGQALYYYFSVWDNDAIHGAKRTDSRKMSFRNLTYSELVDQNKERAEKIEEKVTEGLDITEQLKEKVDDLKMSQLMEKKEDWEMKSKLKEMEEMQMLLEEMVNTIKQENQIRNVEQNKFDLGSERLMKKQEEIQDLLEKIMDDELKKLLEEFEELVEETNKGKQLEKLDELDMNLEKLERQLDVSLELLKRFEIEKEVFRTANELEKMAEEMENMDLNQDSTGIEEKKKEFDKLNENYQEQIDKNQELSEPMKLEDFEEEREELSEEMDEMNEMNQNNGSKNEMEKKKKSAQDKMSKLGQQMREMMLGASGEQDMVDIELLRQLARELNDYSFKQEDLIGIIQRVNSAHPEYEKAGVEQRELKEKFSVIRDSLVSLGYKQPSIAKLLNQEMFHVETALENLMKSYQDGRKSQVSIEQQNIMTGANELAVRLDEIIQSAQNQSGSGGGKSSFTDSKPKSGKDKIGDMKGKQQSLKQQLEGMIQQMKNNKGGKPDNKSLAKMLADREMLRQALEKLQNSGELGEPAKGKLNEVQQLMEQVEKDIIYNRLGDNTIRREKMIETKLLEAEQAEMERELEEKREANEFKGTIKPPDEKIWKDFEQEKKKTLELMRYRDIKLKEFYRKKYFDYLEQLEKRKN